MFYILETNVIKLADEVKICAGVARDCCGAAGQLCSGGPAAQPCTAGSSDAAVPFADNSGFAMHIKRVVLEGFKCYKSRTESEPFSSKHNVVGEIANMISFTQQIPCNCIAQDTLEMCLADR
eukprot:6203971-Pleurochrysis_carterae.AAC.1